MNQWLHGFLVSILFLVLQGLPAALAKPAQVALLRHGEEPASGPHLSSQGARRAQALVNYFTTDPDWIQHGVPVAVYAAGTDPDHDSTRSIETVTPLARALGLTVLSDYARRDVDEIAEEVLTIPAYDGKFVVICWAHAKLPKLAKALGAKGVPSEWGEDVYNHTWLIQYDASGQGKRLQDKAQHLLPEDH